jgi:hypothetical protein
VTRTSLTAPIKEGHRVYFVGHSFHMFIVRPLIMLAKEAGIKGHWAEGWDMIGGSTPMQHWERNGEDNEVKAALRTGKVEVLTLSTNVVMPEPAIDLFADLAYECNPDVRVMVQQSWGDDITSAIMRVRHGLDPAPAGVEAAVGEIDVADGTALGAAEPGGAPTIDPALAALYEAAGTNEQRDAVTAADLARYRSDNQSYRQRFAAQIDAINQRHGRTTAWIVPVNEGVIRLREAVVGGQLPGITRQSELFRDALGHATQPTSDLVSYIWFAALYRQSPVGLKALVDAGDAPGDPVQHEFLQLLAWNTVLDEPRSGVGAA